MNKPHFSGGGNIALKLPPGDYDAALAFYHDVLCLPAAERIDGTAFHFGSNLLWLDRCPQLSQAEVWLEVRCEDTTAAAAHLAEHDVQRCDEIEPLPVGFDGFWIRAPGNLVQLISGPGVSPASDQPAARD